MLQTSNIKKPFPIKHEKDRLLRLKRQESFSAFVGHPRPKPNVSWLSRMRRVQEVHSILLRGQLHLSGCLTTIALANSASCKAGYHKIGNATWVPGWEWILLSAALQPLMHGVGVNHNDARETLPYLQPCSACEHLTM